MTNEHHESVIFLNILMAADDIFDFLCLVDNNPVLLIEVKVSDDTFSPSLLRFHQYLSEAKPYQIVYNLKHKKSKGPVKMLPVHEFLQTILL